LSAVAPIADKFCGATKGRDEPCVGGSELARTFFTFAALVGAALSALIRCEETDGIFFNVNFMTEADLIQQDRALPSHGSGLYCHNASVAFSVAPTIVRYC